MVIEDMLHLSLASASRPEIARIGVASA